MSFCAPGVEGFTDEFHSHTDARTYTVCYQGMQAQFEFLSHSFHSGIITGLSACIRKPLVATCSMDHSIRIWNYETGSDQADIPLSSVHPSSFTSILVLVSMLQDYFNIHHTVPSQSSFYHHHHHHHFYSALNVLALNEGILFFYLSVLELYKEFQEESYSVALHPSGLFVLAGFSDKLRLMNLLIDDIRTFKEFTVRCCREVRPN